MAKRTKKKNKNNDNNIVNNNQDVSYDNNESTDKKAPFFIGKVHEAVPKEHYIYYLPIVFVLGYLPMLMRTMTFDTFLERYDWVANANATQVDVFLKIKAIFLIVISVFMLLVMAVWFFNGNKARFNRLKSKPFYLVFASIILVIISGIFAENKPLLLVGGFENFESIFVFLAYFVTMIYTFLVFSQSDNMSRDFTFVYRASLPGFLIISVIGFFQVFGLDLFKTDFGKILFASSEFRTGGGSISVGEGEYTTLHNIDYVSTFFAMWIFIFLILFTMSKDTKEKVVRAFLVVFTTFDMVMAGSDGGRLGFLAGVAVLLILLSVNSKKRLIISIGAMVAAVALVLIIPQTRAYIIAGIGASDDNSAESFKTHHITPKEDGVYFDMDGKEYSISYKYEINDKGQAQLYATLKDEAGNPIEGTFYEKTSSSSQYYEYPESAITKGTIVAEYDYKADEDTKAVRAVMIGSPTDTYPIVICNIIGDDGEYYFLNVYGKWVQDDGTDIAEVDIFPDNLFSGRGKIWNRTIPILKDYLLIGCGSGLFITAFPQDNYIERMNGITNYDVKPHNLFMQYWVEQGLIFLLLMLAFFVIFYIKVIKLIRVADDSYETVVKKRIAVACASAVAVFLGAGIAGDSMIVHAPVFWTFLGIGLAASWDSKPQSE